MPYLVYDSFATFDAKEVSYAYISLEAEPIHTGSRSLLQNHFSELFTRDFQIFVVSK